MQRYVLRNCSPTYLALAQRPVRNGLLKCSYPDTRGHGLTKEIVQAIVMLFCVHGLIRPLPEL